MTGGTGGEGLKGPLDWRERGSRDGMGKDGDCWMKRDGRNGMEK